MLEVKSGARAVETTRAADKRSVRSLGVERPGRCGFFEYEEGEVPEGHFRLDTLYTGLSAGTELTFFKGTNPYLSSRWDQEYGAFREGEPGQTWPMPFLGYMEVGRVSASRAAQVKPGDIVGMAYGHKTGHTANAAQEFFVQLPEGVDPILGIYLAQMGPICANGLLHAAADAAGQKVQSLGDGVRDKNVLVTGAGVVGLLTGLFALEHGAANVAIVDSTPARLEAAEHLGMTAIDEERVQVWQYCKEAWRDGPARGADLVFQCRARPAMLHTALKSLRPQGTVVDLAFYQGGASEVRLGEEFHHNGLTIRCAQINRVPRGLSGSWDRARLAHETGELLRTRGQAMREHMITDVVSFDEAPQLVADLAARRAHAIQAVFQVVV